MNQSTMINHRKSNHKRRLSLINLTNDINFKRCIATNQEIDYFIRTYQSKPKACRITRFKLPLKTLNM